MDIKSWSFIHLHLFNTNFAGSRSFPYLENAIIFIKFIQNLT